MVKSLQESFEALGELLFCRKLCLELGRVSVILMQLSANGPVKTGDNQGHYVGVVFSREVAKYLSRRYLTATAEMISDQWSLHPLESFTKIILTKIISYPNK